MNECVVGIDIGYGETKSFSGTGAVKFPTAVTSRVRKETFGTVETILVNSTEYVVGRDAADTKWAIDTRTSAFVGSEPWLVPLGHALLQHKMEPLQMRGGHIVLGLPPGYFTKTKADELAAFVKRSSISKNGSRFDLSSTKISFVPQGAGIYFVYLSDIDKDAQEKNIAVVDIGHYTIDMVYFKRGRYIEGATFSSTMGISMLLDDICEEFNRENKLMIGHKEAQKLLINGEVTILQETHRLPQLPTILKSYSEKVATTVDRYFASLEEKPDIGVAAGGGIIALFGKIKFQNKVVGIQPDPVIANARGYYLFGMDGKG